MAARGWMTVAEVEARVALIRGLDSQARDHEAAHASEDTLLRDVLRQIMREPRRDGSPSPRALALALRSLLDDESGGPRWCG